MKTTRPWHSSWGTVYHNHSQCTTGLVMTARNVQRGTGGKPLCSECAALHRTGSPQVVKGWMRSSVTERIVSFLI